MISFDTFIDIQLKTAVLCTIYFIIKPFLERYSASFRYRTICTAGYMLLLLSIIQVTNTNVLISISTEIPIPSGILIPAPDDLVEPIHGSTESYDFTLFLNYGLYAYLFCVTFLIFRFLKQLKYSYKIKRNAEILDYFKGVPIFVSEVEQTPFTIGAFKPVIILPKSSISWSIKRRENILNHEFAHIKSYDFISNVIFQMLKAVFFINPLYHVFFRELILLRELSCDEYVMQKQIKASDYATDIVDIARCMVNTNQESFVINFTSKKHIEKRIKSLFEFHESSKKGNSFLTVIVLSLLISTQLFAFEVVCEPLDKNNNLAVVSGTSDIRFIKPLDKIKILMKYGESKPAKNSSKRVNLHMGIDLAGVKGDKVYATADGRISYSKYKGGYGLLVQISHEKNYTTRYAHLSEIRVKNGDLVKAGDVIGKIGSTGRTTGDHLHYEILKKGAPLNPLDYLK